MDTAAVAAVAVPPHARSDCACLPVVPDKQRLCTTVVGPLTPSIPSQPGCLNVEPLRGSTYSTQLRRSIQIDYSNFSPRPGPQQDSAVNLLTEI